jgi:CO/xanthine dehydrogenase FAD-binding subunit
VSAIRSDASLCAIGSFHISGRELLSYIPCALVRDHRVSCAAAGQFTGNRWLVVAVFLGAVAPVPYQIESALLQSGDLSSKSIDSVVDSISAQATPLTQNRYKVSIARAC